MDLREYLLLLLRRWLTFVVTFVLVVAAGVGASFLMKPTYRATTELYVRADPANLQATAGVGKSSDSAILTQERGDSVILARLKSYAMAANSEAVLDAVADDLALDEGFSSLNRRISTEVLSDSYVLQITATGRTGEDAANVANAVAARLPAVVASIDGARSPMAALAQFSVLQQALPPEERISPNLKLNTAVTLLVALFLAVLFAVLVETFDTRLRRGSQVAANGVRFLGAVPTLRERARATLLCPSEQSPELDELFTRLAVEVRIAAGRGSSRLVVTSPRDGAGTTSVAVNLAARLAAGGDQVLLIDTDNGASTFTTGVDLSAHAGLTDVVVGSSELDSALLFWKPGGFTVLPHGRTRMNTAEMLGGPSFQRLLGTVEGIFDVVVLDAPSLLKNAHAGLLVEEGALALLVAEARHTRRSEFRAASDAVRRAGGVIAGAVLTRTSRSAAIATAAESTDAPEVAPR